MLEKRVTRPEFPDERINYIKTVVEPREAAEAAQKAAEQAEAVIQAELVQEQVKPVYEAPKQLSETQSGELIAGTLGYISPITNCVTFVNQFGKNQPGNPITWIPTTNTPFIGAAVLFYTNHVAILTGYGNGFVEVAHGGCATCSTRYPMSAIRGYF